MAEFLDLVRAKRRLCNAYKDRQCNGCPMFGYEDNDLCGIISISGYLDSEFEEVEKTLVRWDAEHPEPVYPTWRELLGKLYPDAELIIDAIDQKIPADIAQKLGLQPKEG